MLIKYYHNDDLVTEIHADYKNESVKITNYTNNVFWRAFGVNESPTWEDYERFLESRCVPRTRDKLKLYLREIGVQSYDPLAIVMKTQGRMAGDFQWLEVLEE